MPLVKCPIHIFEPNPLACGQAVLAMLSGLDVNEIFEMCETERETTLKCMQKVMESLNIDFSKDRIEVEDKTQLPNIALLSLETPKCWHWSLYFKGLFYDPEYGVLEDFPKSNRKYYWEIKEPSL